MKRLCRIVTALILCLSLHACCSGEIPDWKRSSFSSMEKFTENFLSGEEERASFHFDQAVENIKKSGNMKVLQRAYLTKCAVSIASLETRYCNEFDELQNIESFRENNNYHDFLTGNMTTVDVTALPPQYRDFFKVFTKGTVNDINDRIQRMKDPLSRLIATGISAINGNYNVSTLMLGIDTASEQGWKKALLRYMEQLVRLYEQNGDSIRAQAIQKKMDLIRK